MLRRHEISDSDWERFQQLLHGRFDGLGHPVEWTLTAARASDISQAETLFSR